MAAAARGVRQNGWRFRRHRLAQWTAVSVRRPAASFFLHRAQVILILVALLTVILTTPVGVVLLVLGPSDSVALIGGILILAFTAASVVGVVVGSLVLRRGAALVKTQNDFLSLVSHELRTPMTSMRMYVEALRDDRLTDRDERDRCLTVLHREMGRMEKLVVRLLELSRAQARQEPSERELVAMEDVVQQAVASLDAIDLEARAAVVVEVERGAFVRGDRTSLVGALTNLLANAWKYSGDPPRIHLSVRSLRGRWVHAEVRDNGPGVDNQERQSIFQPFQRGRAAEQAGVPGSGLGLALVKAIAEGHGGRIEARNAEGGGAAFRLILPRAKAPVAAAATTAARSAPSNRPGPLQPAGDGPRS